jgi:hypothetical protein
MLLWAWKRIVGLRDIKLLQLSLNNNEVITARVSDPDPYPDPH